MRAYCTLFDRNYAGRAVALHASLRRHAPDAVLWACCMDDEAKRILERLALPGLRILTADDLESWDQRLAAARADRSRIEYYFTCAPAVPLWLLDNHKEVDTAVYVDADLFFFADPEPLFEELGDNAVLVVEHRFPRRLARLAKYGRFNVGLLAFRRDPDGLACLRWWHERCLEWCHDRLEGERYGDQKYLDQWPSRFRRVHVLQHKGGGVGPWNLATFPIAAQGGGLAIGGDALVFAHLHGVRKAGDGRYRLGASAYRFRLPVLLRERLYRPYIEALERAEAEVRRAAAGLPPPTPLPRSWAASAGPGERLARAVRGVVLPRLDRARARLYGDYLDVTEPKGAA